MTAVDKTPHETEKQLADDYLSGAVLAREVSHKALQQALRDAEAGTLRDPAKTAMNAAITSGTLLDKRLVLQERPTQHISIEDPRAKGLALLRAHGITVEGTAVELPPIEQPTLEAPRSASEPLPRQAGRAKPRTPARDRSVSSPAD